MARFEVFAGQEHVIPKDRLEGRYWDVLDVIGIPRLRVHPCYLVTPESHHLYQAWRAYQTGILPEPGGLFQQSSYVLACFRIFESAQALILEREREKRRGAS